MSAVEMSSADTARHEQAACSALAGLLRAQAMAGHFAMVLVLIAALVLLSGRSSGAGLLLPAAVLVLAPPERYLALRLAFDCALFAAWGRGTLDAGATDAALSRLGLKRHVLPARPFDDRIAGTLRLLRTHVVVVLVQLTLVVASLGVALT